MGAGFGISFWQAVVVSTIGVVVSFLLCGLIAIAGKRGSAPTMVLSRAALYSPASRPSRSLRMAWLSPSSPASRAADAGESRAHASSTASTARADSRRAHGMGRAG